MRRFALSLCVFAGALCAQTADIAYFRAVMLPSNETPPTSIGATGMADIVAHVVRDSSGQIINGTVDFLVRVNVQADTNAVGLHIHSGPASVAGPVVIGTNLSAGSPAALKAGANTINLPVQVTGDNAAALAALRGLFQDPTQYYVNMHTPDFPAGAIRGQLIKAVGTVLMGVMSSDNEVPAPGVAASGMAVVIALATLDASGAFQSGETYISTTYSLEDRGTFTGFHIHPGATGTNGPAVLGATLPANMTIDSTGSGTVGPFYIEVNPTNATQLGTFANLFFNPTADYINIHTNQHPGGVMRAQLRRTDTMTFPVLMSSANEVAKTTVSATAPTLITLHTLRNEDGSIAAGTVLFDVNYRFPGATQFTGLHIHDGDAGVNGPISIPMVPTFDPAFSTDTGFGNYFNWTPGVLNLATLEDITKDPEVHYVNIHTPADPVGAARGQLAAPVTAVPAITSALVSTLDTNSTVIAPGGLISIFGKNLVKVGTDLSGWAGKTLPFSLNGATVMIGAKPAPILYISPTQINAQVPIDVGMGVQPVVVNNGVGPSASFMVNVVPAAPEIFVNPVQAVLKNSDFSVVSDSNPVHVGDVIVIYLTGMGVTVPTIPTGGLVPAGTVANTIPVTAKLADKDATVLYSIASPGYAGLYQVAVQIPPNVSGSVPLQLLEGTAKANVVNIPVQ